MELNKLSHIGLGTWQLSNGVGELGRFWPALDEQTVSAIVEASLSAGVNWFDTAEKYGDGESERALSQALKAAGKTSSEVFIADKWWPKNRKAKSLVETIDQRLACLNGYPIGLYQIHWPESESWLRTEVKYLAKLVEMGKVTHVGLCNYNWRQVRRAHKLLKNRGIKLASVQVRYSLTYRSIEKNNLLRLSEDLDFKIIAWSPLDSGLLTGHFHETPSRIGAIQASRRKMYGIELETIEKTQPLMDQLSQIANKYGAVPAQVALCWLTQRYDGRVMAIPGASSASQAANNAKSMNTRLEGNELAVLDELSMSLSRI